jgi:hypothetical protein
MGQRVVSVPSPKATDELAETGRVVLPGLLTADDCRELIELYGEARAFRSRIVMERHGFGKGEYQYFSNPLPATVRQLRNVLYPQLSAVANRWSEQLGKAGSYPVTLDTYLDLCHAAGQSRPTPLLLKYGPGDFNRLHQDVYGDLMFPLQVTVLLSEPGQDFDGGEFVLVEQRPRTQSMAEVVPLTRGDAVVFTVRDHPVAGSRGFYRAVVRHGVSRLRRGERYALGVIFHDAR